uniref:Uncharacterized protein n=1 Tax=Anguilla anguilla TaxID=7936 RepID=A0A0E9QUP3_ANGAN
MTYIAAVCYWAMSINTASSTPTS